MKPIINIKIMYKMKKPVWLWNFVLSRFTDKVIPIKIIDREGNWHEHNFPIGVRVGIKRTKDARFCRIRDLLFFRLLRFRVGKNIKKESNKDILQIVKEMKYDGDDKVLPDKNG